MGKLYYTITEVAEMLEVNASLLRYWENEFDCLRPHKNKKGNRSYTQQDIDMLRKIMHLTRDCGFTLSRAREQLKADTVKDEKLQLKETLTAMRNFLSDLKEQL